MQQSVQPRSTAGPAVLGLVLIVFGGAALFSRAAGFDLFGGKPGWPLFVIVPGVVLLAASLIPPRPQGIGLATAGAIVTTVGSLLLYQWQTNHWESWAYAWALLPAAAGLGQLAYGLYAGEREMLVRGGWLVAIGGVMFVIGAWFFEGLFAGEWRPEGSDWWPIGLIVIGGIVLAGAFLGRGGPAPVKPFRSPAPPTSPPGEPPSEPVDPA